MQKNTNRIHIQYNIIWQSYWRYKFCKYNFLYWRLETQLSIYQCYIYFIYDNKFLLLDYLLYRYLGISEFWISTMHGKYSQFRIVRTTLCVRIVTKISYRLYITIIVTTLRRKIRSPLYPMIFQAKIICKHIHIFEPIVIFEVHSIDLFFTNFTKKFFTKLIFTN